MRAIGSFFLICSLTLSVFSQPVPCGSDAEMTPLCADACIVCDVDGFEGRHESNVMGEAPDDFCTFVVHNAQWIAFLAGSEELTVKISVSNCDGGIGLEIAIYESLDCENFSLISNCFGGMTGSVSEGNSAEVIVNEPLTIGQYYYIVMDGTFGDNCDWSLEVVNGNTEVAPLTSSGLIEGDLKVCPGMTNEYEVKAEVGATMFEWTLNDSILNVEGMNVAIDWTDTGFYELCVTSSNPCDIAPPTCVSVEVLNIIPEVFNEVICSDESFLVGDSIVLEEEGSYEFNFLSAEGCDSIVFVNLEVVENSNVSIDVAICEGDSLYIGNIPFFETGQYEETLQNHVGCDSVVSLDLLMVICEMQGLVSETPVVCYGESSGMLTFQVSDGTSPFNYTWQNLENTLSGNGILNEVNEFTTITNLPVGTYLITINDNFGNDLILIQEITQAPILANEWSISDHNGYAVTCYNSSDGWLEAIPTGGAGPYFFTWNNGEQTALLNNIPYGNYEVTITDSHGCSISVNNTLSQPSPISFQAIYNNVSCLGLETGSIEIINTNGGLDPYLYSLDNSPFQVDSSFTTLTEGQYSISIEDSNGCTEDTIAYIQAPIIPEIDLGEDLNLYLGESISLMASSNIVLDSVQWSNQEGLDCYTCPSPNAGPYFSTSYTLTAISEDDCIGSDSILVNVVARRRVIAPNVFSPNEDGINDLFNIHAGNEATRVIDFKVFSRWGELVFEQQDFLPNAIGVGWDGTHRERLAEKAIYVWFAEVEFLDGVVQPFQGDVLLLR